MKRSGKRPLSSASASGFALVEVIVALAILSLSVSLIYESLGWALRRSASTTERERASTLAHSILADVRTSADLKLGRQNYLSPDGIRAIVDIDRYPTAVESPSSYKPILVTIAVRSNRAEIATLRSIELTSSLP